MDLYRFFRWFIQNRFIACNLSVLCRRSGIRYDCPILEALRHCSSLHMSSQDSYTAAIFISTWKPNHQLFEVILSSFSSRCLCTLHVSIQYTYYIYIQYISHSPKLWMSFTLVLKRKQIQKKAQTPIFLNKRSSVIIHPWRFSGFRTNLPQHLPIFPILAGWQGVARDGGRVKDDIQVLHVNFCEWKMVLLFVV